MANQQNEETDFLAQIRGMNDSGIPYDSDCIGQTLLQTAFGFNSNFLRLKQDFATLQSYGKHFVLVQPAVVGRNGGSVFDGFVKASNGSTDYVATIKVG